MSSSEGNVITEQPISATVAETTEFSLFGKSKSDTNVANLEVLKDFDSMIVKQEYDVIGSACDKCFCCDKINKYKIKDTDGKTILTAVEEEEPCCDIKCCRRGRRFQMKVMDKNEAELMRLKLKNQCCGRCCCFCKYEKLQVYSPVDNKIGSIEEVWNCFHKQLLIYSTAKSDPVYCVDGPNCESCRCCCSDFTFTISDYETGEECGSIAKKWNGLCRESLTYVDNFRINFPKNIELNQKAILLGTCIMIDLMYFEKNPPSKEKDED